MATLELRKTSNWWYGRWTEKGKTVVCNLDIRVEGRRPANKEDTGDRRFRTSREAANAKLEQLASEATTRKHVEGLAQTIHVARTGRRVGAIQISDIMDAWLAIPRRQQKLGATYISGAKGVFNRFNTFMTSQFPGTEEMSDVTPCYTTS